MPSIPASEIGLCLTQSMASFQRELSALGYLAGEPRTKFVNSLVQNDLECAALFEGASATAARLVVKEYEHNGSQYRDVSAGTRVRASEEKATSIENRRFSPRYAQQWAASQDAEWTQFCQEANAQPEPTSPE